MNELYIKQKVFKITDHYQVFSEQQTPVYQVDQEFKLLGNTVRVSNIDGEQLFVVDRELLTLLPRYNVLFSDGSQALVKSQFSFFKKKIDIEYQNLSLQANGNFWDYSFEISQQDTVIATIEKEILAWADTYKVTIMTPELEQLVLAAVIAIDNIKDIESNN